MEGQRLNAINRTTYTMHEKVVSRVEASAKRGEESLEEQWQGLLCRQRLTLIVRQETWEISFPFSYSRGAL